MTTTVSPVLADHAVVGPPQGQWTVADWESLPEDGQRYEIVDGVLHMTTSPSFFHQWIVGAWIRYVGIPAQEQALGIWTTAPIGLILAPNAAVQPDFAFIRSTNIGIIHDRRIWGAPDLVVEVLSPGNSTTELATKRALYARSGVPEYVEVDPASRTLLHYQRSANGDYPAPLVFGEADTVTLACLPAVPLQVRLLFADAPDTTL